MQPRYQRLYPATHDLLGAGGEKLIALDGNDNWLSTNIYAHGELVATYDAAGTHYNFSDWLGTRRMQTDIYGNPQEVCMGGAFGEVNCPMPSADPAHFADKDRDTESGLDDFGARYYNSGLGRFMSPDWSAKAGAIPYADLTDPQSLNLYSYVRNHPWNSADLDGHDDYLQSESWYGGEYESFVDTEAAEKNEVQASQVQNSNAAQQNGYQQPNVANPAEVTLTNVTYNETAGMRADPKAKPGDKDSANQLHDARLAVAEIANRILNSNHPGREQAPNDLSSKTVADLNAGNKDIIAAHNDALSASRQALSGSNTTNGAMHFRTGTAPFDSLYGNKATMVFGPFNNAQGGKVYLTVAP